MAAANDGATKAPPVIERFVRQLVIANKAVALYPPSSAIPRDTSEQCLAALRDVLRERPDVRLVVDKRGLFYESAPVFPDQPAFSAFAHELYLRKLADVRFHAGVEPRDIIAFLSILKFTPEELTQAGGFESRLWEQGVGTITVAEAQVTLVEADSSALAAPAEEGADQPRPESEHHSRFEVDDLLAAAYGGRQRDQLVIARVIGDSNAVRDYLQETLDGGIDGLPDLKAAGERFAELAQIAHDIGGAERPVLVRSLADALRQLEAGFGRDLLVEQMLPQARTSEALAEVIRELGLEEVTRMFAHGLANGEIEREALVRAVRNLALISQADRDDVLAAAGAAMLGAGVDESAASSLLEQASPTHLRVSGGTGPARAQKPVDAVLQLMALAPSSQLAEDEVEGLLEVRAQAQSGVTDGDVIGTLVSLVSMDKRESQFASTMSTLEDALSLLVDRGEFEVAADAAAQLRDAADDPAFTAEQRTRLRHAIGRFSRPGDVRALAKTLQLYGPSTPEHEAARRLLDTLGPLAIQPLLEQLADEPSMSARKALVDLLSDMAGDYVQEFGDYVTDGRWYFVRNVVTILGSTKSAASLPLLERTLRHADARVRRETIRALSGNPDRLAREMLVAALSDDDAQNVQLAARYLGSSGARSAIPTLELVAKGEGRGNRDNGPRVEAIEALGRLGAVEALPTLEALAGKRRTLIRASKTRELKAAAQSAITAIKVKGATR